MIVKDTRKDFCTYLSGKRKDVENVGPLLNGAEDLVTQVLNTFFTSSSTSKTNLHKTQALTTTGKAWSSVDLTLMEEYLVREYVNKLDTFKSLDPGGMNSRVQRDLADVVVENNHDK